MQPATNNERAAGNLPVPVPENVPESAATTTSEQPLETLAPSSERATQNPPAPVFSLPVPPAPAPDPLATASPPDASATTTTVVPATADDADLIEKEWVTKAKNIVEKTQEDPYQQSKELTIFKADYMKKRYNKTIKLSE
jgi:hypothetical protein